LASASLATSGRGSIAAAATTTIVAQHSGKCLDVTGGPQATGNGAPLEQYKCTGASNQSWTVNDTGAGLFELVASNSHKCAEAAGGGTDDRTPIQQATCNRLARQLWRLRDNGSGIFEIVNVGANRCLDVTGGPQQQEDEAKAELWRCTGELNQAWALTPSPVVPGHVVARHSGKCLDVLGGPRATGNDVPIEQWTCTGASNQFWTIKDVGAGVELIAQNSGRCLEAADGGTINETPIEQRDCAGDPAQLWTMQTTAVAGEYKFVHVPSGRCLDVVGGPQTFTDGKRLELYDCTGAANQTWRIPAQTPPLTRDPRQWPFAQNSIWNMPIGSGAQFVAANLSAHPGIAEDPDATEPVPEWATMPQIDPERIVLAPTAPLVTIEHGAPGGDRCDADDAVTAGLPVTVPIPSNYFIESDHENNCAAFLMPDQRTIVQVQPFTRCRAKVVPTAVIKYPRDPDPDVTIDGDGILGMHGGSGLSSIGGSIRVGELRPGNPAPRHALKIDLYSAEALFECRTVTPLDKSNCRRWPATKADSSAFNDKNADPPGYGTRTQNRNQAMKMGALLALPPSVNIASLGLETDPGRQIAWTLQNYGAYIVDSFAGPAFAFSAEEGPDPQQQDARTSVQKQFLDDYKYKMMQRVRNADADKGDNPWTRDIQRLLPLLKVVDNNSPTSIGGGGTPRQPLAPPFQ
jgi:hypothetical protein